VHNVNKPLMCLCIDRSCLSC